MNEDQKIACANFDNKQVFQHVAILHTQATISPMKKNWGITKIHKNEKNPN
jgi:hypothetical protein